MLPMLLAQASNNCTLNGQSVDCGTAVKAAGGILAGAGLFLIFMFAFAAVNFVFWILSLIHLIKHEDVKDRVLWILLIFLIPLAAWVYYLGIRKSYEKEHQNAAYAQPPVTPGPVPPYQAQPQQPVAPSVVPPVVPGQPVQPTPPPTPTEPTPPVDPQPPASPLVQ